jgi:hypothetical protein
MLQSLSGVSNHGRHGTVIPTRTAGAALRGRLAPPCEVLRARRLPPPGGFWHKARMTSAAHIIPSLVILGQQLFNLRRAGS